jgi:hypothetical protein
MEVSMSHSKMVETRRRRQRLKKRFSREAKLAEKQAKKTAKATAGSGEQGAARRANP